jgi:class 3 adenylate cyclase/tetratricopeptide (TPR) repeat protein
MLTCARCGAESPEGFRFCPACGAVLPEALPPRQLRKVVTALFCDVTGSTALGEQLDPELLRSVINRYFAELRATIERHGGTIDRFHGDAFMAVFGIPRVQEDDALRAVRAAAEIRERLPAIADEVRVELRFRTGVNTGPVLMGEGENLAIGDAINVAARLEQAARPGEILLGEQTLRLVRDAVEVEALEPLELKGKSERVPAYRLVQVDPAAPGLKRHLDVPLVDRKRELALLHQAWERAVQESRCHLFSLLGEAGVGKSRLVSELLSSIGDQATVLRGRCLHYGDGITFWPLVEALLPLGERAGQVLEHLSSGGAATPEELFWEVRRLLESLATEHPVVLYLDDLHWAETMLLDLLDHIADLSRGVPILLLCTARPELLDDRPAWGGGKLTAATVLLEPLVGEDSEALLDALGDGLDPEVRARVIVASEGNPLFLEEMVALARERGTVEVPPSIEALLAARLERLGAEERELLERGAVEGEVFHRLAVKALAGERLAAEIELRLSGLVRKELIRPHPATLSGDEAFRFRHLLIRDAAYDGLPKATRAELHERFALWLEEHATELLEFDEIAGWHFEQAVRYGAELGREVEPALARRAAEHLFAAGQRARGRSDIGAARNLLERAHEIAPAGDRLRVRIGVGLAEELIVAGDLARADGLLSVGEQDPERALDARLTRLEWLNSARPDGVGHRIQSLLPGMLEQLAEHGDERGLAKAHMAAFWAHWAVSQARPAAAELRLAADHAVRAEDNVLRARALGWQCAALMWGPFDVETVARELDALEREPDPGPFVVASVTMLRGELARLHGDLDEALAITKQAKNQYAALGGYVMVGGSDQLMARLEVLAGRPGPARELLLSSDALFERAGDRGFRSTTLAMLAKVHDMLGDREAARSAIELCEEIGGQEDVINYAITDAVRARLALAEGDNETAERWARSAADRAFETDFTFVQGEALLTLSFVLERLARREESISAATRALDLFEAKGDTLCTAQARAQLEDLSAPV